MAVLIQRAEALCFYLGVLCTSSCLFLAWVAGLVLTATGKYQTLPANSVVYLTLNTDTYPNYRITGGGIVIN